MTSSLVIGPIFGAMFPFYSDELCFDNSSCHFSFFGRFCDWFRIFRRFRGQPYECNLIAATEKNPGTGIDPSPVEA